MNCSITEGVSVTILEAMAARLDNEPITEERRALDEIHKIARFRLNGMF